MIVWIFNIKDESEALERKQLVTELLDKTSNNKGLILDYNYSKISDNILGVTIEIKVTK